MFPEAFPLTTLTGEDSSADGDTFVSVSDVQEARGDAGNSLIREKG